VIGEPAQSALDVASLTLDDRDLVVGVQRHAADEATRLAL
jgi:hypothetical protein